MPECNLAPRTRPAAVVVWSSWKVGLSEAIRRIGEQLLAHKSFGAIEILGLREYVAPNAGIDDEPTMRFELVVSSPGGSQGAWSTEDVFNLRSEAWALLAQEGISLTPTVDLLPDNPSRREMRKMRMTSHEHWTLTIGYERSDKT